MKTVLVIILSLCLLFSMTALASAEILFGASAETGAAAFSANYASKSAGIYVVDGNFNLLGTHVRLEYGVSDLNPYKFTTSSVKVGWGFGIPTGLVDLEGEVFGGYHRFVFTDNAMPTGGENTYGSWLGGVMLQTRINRLTLSGAFSLPLKTNYSNGVTEDPNAGLNDLVLGVSYSPIPLVDLFVNYRSFHAGSTVINLAAQGYTLGAKISF